MTELLSEPTAMTTFGIAFAALAALAALRRLVRTAVMLGTVALVAGLGQPVLGSAGDQLRDVGLDLRGALDAVTGSRAESVRGRRPEAVDGDTFNLRANGRAVKVRVALVDAGESSASRYGSSTCGGEAATRFARAWAARRRTVRLHSVPGLPAEDRYGRRLARLVDRGRDYGLAAVRRGWARIAIYEQPHGSGAAYLARLKAAEAGARAASRGAWRACDWTTQEGVR